MTEFLEVDNSKFGIPVKRDALYLYVGKSTDEQNCFYAWMKDEKKKKYIKSNVIEGRLLGLTVNWDKHYKEEHTPKLKIRLLTNQGAEVHIESGLGTWFSRGFLMRILKLPNNEAPFQLGAFISKESKVIFCYLKQRDQTVPMSDQYDPKTLTKAQLKSIAEGIDEIYANVWNLDEKDKIVTYNTIGGVIEEEPQLDHDGVPVEEEEVPF